MGASLTRPQRRPEDSAAYDEPVSDVVELARAATPAGEVALRLRGDVVELIVNGVFAMDSAEVTSELALADAAGDPPGRVLVGGLGLGYTAARLLERGAALVDVVELAAPLLDWAAQAITPQLGRLAADPRIRLRQGDIVTVMQAAEEAWDAILLDVDNGPTFLIHRHNERVYAEAFLGRCLGMLTDDGVLVIWCETASPELRARLETMAPVEVIEVPVSREGRRLDYVLYRARRPATTTRARRPAPPPG